jgi:hypothetical protein
MDYDIIGDIHGHADALVALLRKLGYAERAGAWRHPTRTPVFLGDFIDRGPKQLECVRIARSMVDSGTALAVMGNHELNAIAWHTPDPDNPGEFLRPHMSKKYGDKNRKQHEAFLAAVKGNDALHDELVGWFLTLPLWLDLPSLRVVHACWHPRFVDYLAPKLRDRRVPMALLPAATREPADDAEKDTPEPSVFKAVEALTKGLETPLPPGSVIVDKDGHRRERVRVRWWDAEAKTLRQAAFCPEAERASLPDTSVPAHVCPGHPADKPVFVGHYWLTGAPEPLAPRVACTDYSVAQGGRLCAYRYDGEPELGAKKFVSVKPNGE